MLNTMGTIAAPSPRRPLKVRPLTVVTGEPAIICENVEKRFYHYEHRTTSVRELFVRTVLRRPIHQARAEFMLRDFSLRVEKGESVALVGGNGSGKSTALRMIAGIYRPTAGRVVTNGRVAAIIELGVGFHPELTGIENVTQYAAATGLSRRQINGCLEEILDFADIGAFVHEPVRLYSTGMRARLAFAAAIVCANPEVLLVDEILGVGDHAFQERCAQHLHAFRARGGTLVVVSHELETMRLLCGRAVWLDRGMVVMSGPTEEVLNRYVGYDRGAQAATL